MADDITSNQVSSVEYIVRVQLEIFPSSGVCVFGARVFLLFWVRATGERVAKKESILTREI